MKREMIRLATDKEARDRCREAGLKRAQCFNWDKTAAATMNVFARASVSWLPRQAESRFSR
jgi:hypothetical protein